MRKDIVVVNDAGQKPRPMFATRHYCLPTFSGIVSHMGTALDWERLARYVLAARGARSQKDITANGGPSDETISKIEQGRWTPTRSVQKTLDKLDIGLNWTPGSANAVLSGGDPTPLPPRQSPLPPLSEVKPFAGVDALRWQIAIQNKPERERTDEERAWLAASRAEQYRLGNLNQDSSWTPEHGVRDFWAGHARPDLSDLRPLSPETIQRLLTTARNAREALRDAVNSEPTREVIEQLGVAAEAVASSADTAAIESFGGAYEFIQSVPALKEYIEKTGADSSLGDKVEVAPSAAVDAAAAAVTPELEVNRRDHDGKQSG